MGERELSSGMQCNITCVIAVASAITNGTFAKRANVFASSVLPVEREKKLQSQFTLGSKQHHITTVKY
jgi:hypothetical protein